MTLSVGDRIPDAALFVPSEGGPQRRQAAEIFSGRKIVLVGMPGAFTPTCHRNHLPGYVAKAQDIKAKGIDAIAVTSVNDVFVMDAWGKASGADGIELLADGNGDFARAIGLTLDASGNGLGTRSKRYAMVVDNGVVRSINIEDAPGKAEVSGADNLLKSL